MKKKIIISSLSLLILMFFLFRLFIYNPVIESTTQNIDVVSKDQNKTTGEQWINLSNDKKIYVDDFSIWALIQEQHNYTIVYDLFERSGEHRLRTIVPGDYNGQF